MTSQTYPLPSGLRAISPSLLDLHADSEIDRELLHPPPVTGEKNVWFFWDTGYECMHPYAQRNVRAWHRRLSKRGWTVRVLDRIPGSPRNISNFLDVSDPANFPRAFTDGTIAGEYAPQHTSDLVRWPLLLRYGGVYADVGLMQIGDLDRLWNETVGDPASRFEVLSYVMESVKAGGLTNYFLASRPNNPLFARCHRLFLELWAADGGRTSTDGMRNSPLLKGVTMLGAENHSREVQEELSDYIIQGQVMKLVMGLVDEEDGWDGPQYVAEHVYGIDYMVGSQLINEITAWDGRRAWELMSLALPKEGEEENKEQRLAREIVERCLKESFGFKLATGLILKVLGDTLSSLWRKNEGSDDVPGTYAHWLRYATIYLNPDRVPDTMELEIMEPIKKGPLLREY